MLTTSGTAPRARALQSRRVVLTTCTACQQRRGMRFNPWGCSRDSDLHREAHRRQRNFRYQYMESFRKSPWNYENLSNEAHEAIERAMSHDMQSAASRKRNGYVDLEQDAKSWTDEFTGVRPGRNIEDVERELMNHLFNTGQSTKSLNEQWKSPLEKLRSYLTHQSAPKEATPADVSTATASVEAEDITIDPITNRRVIKKSSATFTPKFEDVDNAPNLSSDPKVMADKHTPANWSNPALNQTSVNEKSVGANDVDSFSSKNMDDRDASPAISPEEKSRFYTNLGNYETSPSRDEPTIPRSSAADEPSKNYDDLQSYHAVKYNEPDGLQELTAEEITKKYKDLGSYNAVRWNEPDGLRKLTSEELSKEYQDLDAYGSVSLDDPDGVRRPTPEERSKEYEDLDEYKPFYWNEPDGLSKTIVDELSRKYDSPDYASTHQSMPLSSEGNVSQGSGSSGDSGRNGDALDALTPEEVRANVVRRARDATQEGRLQEMKARYREHWQPLTQEAQKNLEKNSDKQPFILQDQEAADAAKARYHQEWEPVMAEATEQLENQYSQPSDRLSKQLDEQSKHDGAKAQYRDEWDPVMDKAHEQLELDYGKFSHRLEKQEDLQEAKAEYQKHWDPIMKEAYEQPEDEPTKPLRKMTGNYARDFPEEFSTSWSTSNSPSKSTMFPKNKASEETTTSPEPQEEVEVEVEATSMDESFPTESSRLEPALNRHARRRSQKNDDMYSKVPQGLETSYAEEIRDTPTWPTVVKHYGQQDQATTETSEPAEPKTEPTEPHSYKILAYDATTDSIRSADASSAVQATSSPMSPADIILSLSNPAKFFPHFTSLANEGYEMISGNGDVLVFRKVRSASPGAISSVTDTGHLRASPAINPVDMMGREPVTGNFASPTGFVNYDSLREDVTRKPAPPNHEREQDHVREENTSPDKRKKRRPVRKVVLGTTFVAGGAYAVGVIAEHFSTAGSRRR